MKSGYDQYFKKAQSAAGISAKPVAPLKSLQKKSSMDSQAMAKELRRRLEPKFKAKKKSKMPWKLAGVSFIGFLIAALGFQNADAIEAKLHKIEISFFGQASAQEAAAEKPAEPAKAKEGAEAKKEEVATKKEFTDEEINHLSKLNERKRELDAREEELSKMEQEITAQKETLDKKLAELESTRKNISVILEEKVQADDKKIENLVQVYSTMKPPQAAKALEEMDENLAIEIIGRMKKKNAAEVMNLVKPEKVKIFTEKYAGYKLK